MWQPLTSNEKWVLLHDFKINISIGENSYTQNHTHFWYSSEPCDDRNDQQRSWVCVYYCPSKYPPPPPFKGGGGHFKSILLFYAIPPQINMTIGILINTYVLVRKWRSRITLRDSWVSLVEKTLRETWEFEFFYWFWATTVFIKPEIYNSPCLLILLLTVFYQSND